MLVEAVGLQEVGEFERAHIAALSTDFALEIDNNGAEVLKRVAGTQQFIPHSFTIEAQAERLARTSRLKAFIGKRIMNMRAFLRDIQSGLYFTGVVSGHQIWIGP